MQVLQSEAHAGLHTEAAIAHDERSLLQERIDALSEQAREMPDPMRPEQANEVALEPRSNGIYGSVILQNFVAFSR